MTRSPELLGEADAVAAMFRLPLTVIEVGIARLEREFESLLHGADGAARNGGLDVVVLVTAKDCRKAK